jgi:hypothetical protein
LCRWSLIAGRLPGRTTNDVKNYWNTHLRKKEICRIKDDAKEKAQDIVKVNVIKPRPRTVTKKLTWLCGKPTIAKRFEPEDIVSNISPTLMLSENRPTKRWEGLLDHKEGDERALCTIIGLDEEPNRVHWGEKIAPETKMGDTFDDQDGLSCLADFSFDVSLWDFVNAEQEII